MNRSTRRPLARSSYLAAMLVIYHAEIACRYHTTLLFNTEMNLEEVASVLGDAVEACLVSIVNLAKWGVW